MSEQYEKFMESLKATNTKKVAKSVQTIGNYDYTSCTSEDLEIIVLSMRPKSKQAIITICNMLSRYARYLQDDRLYSMVQALDKTSLWLKAKPNAPKKFISHANFEEVYHDIGVYQELNGFYYQTLFRCLYEGIYNDDMSVIKNLRASDIKGNVTTLYEDNGNSYDLEISQGLANDLKELGAIDTWERRNRYTIFPVKITGLFPDSCFKTEIKDDTSKYAYRWSYYRVLRKIAKDLEYSLLPFQIYVSGIMYRINLNLKERSITLEEAFAAHNRDSLVGKIISDELKRCNYDIEVRNFRQIVSGHLDVFNE